MNSECWWSGQQRTGPSVSTKSARSRDAMSASPFLCEPEPRSWACSCSAHRATNFSLRAMERHVLRNCADQFALMMENARLTDRVVGQEALRRDLALAAELQKRLLPFRSAHCEHRRVRGCERAGAQHRRRLLRLHPGGRSANRDRARRRVRQGRGGGAHHVCRAGVPAHHRLRWRHFIAAARRAHERVPLSNDAGNNTRCSSTPRWTATVASFDTSTPGTIRRIWCGLAPTPHLRSTPRRWRSSRSEGPSSACCRA